MSGTGIPLFGFGVMLLRRRCRTWYEHVEWTLLLAINVQACTVVRSSGGGGGARSVTLGLSYGREEGAREVGQRQ